MDHAAALTQIWPFLIGKLITDPVWWFYLYWLPSYLERERGQNPLASALLIGGDLHRLAAWVRSWVAGFRAR